MTTQATPATGTIETVIVDAHSVTIDTNIRQVTTLDPEFVESVRQYGIQCPALGYRDNTGTIHIRAGQRRTLAARETGQALPVVLAIRDDSTSQRIIEQLIENDQRTDLSASERVIAWKQLEIEGLTVTKIAKAVGKSKAHVTAALTVAHDPASLTAMDALPVDLLHLAAALEFADDAETRDSLLQYAADCPEQFDHALERARTARESRLRVLAREAELEAEGKTILRRNEVNSETYDYLRDLEQRSDIEVTIAGEPDIRTVVALMWNDTFREEEVMVNYRAYGYDKRHYSGSAAASGPMTDEQKADRKRLISRNRQWDAAQNVRVRWVGEFLSRKQFPSDCGAFVTISLARFGYDLGTRGLEMSSELLKIEDTHRGAYKSALAELVEVNPAKAGVVALAIILGQLEKGTNRQTWRAPTAEGKHYLLALEAWGYALSPVEKIGAGYQVADTDTISVGDDDAYDEAGDEPDAV